MERGKGYPGTRTGYESDMRTSGDDIREAKLTSLDGKHNTYSLDTPFTSKELLARP
jgi:hypothetical protein